MEHPSPARLYATVGGALLFLAGILGFFYGASFGGPGSVEHALGALRVNGWLNALHVVLGAMGLLLAGVAARAYSLAAGLLLTALAVWGWALGGGGAILGFLPAAGGDEALHLALGLLGLAAAKGTPRAAPGRFGRPPSKPRAEAAGEGA